MRRRDFVRAIVGSATAWPLKAHAQQERVRRVGVLVPGANGDADQQFRLKVFLDRLRDSGWTDGRNLKIDVRYAAGNAEQFRTYAAELLAERADVLVADSTPATVALQRQTRTVPIVFTRVTDPVGQGFVANMARPGANITGFINYEPAIASKWMDLLKDVAPNIKHVAVLYNPQTAPYTRSFLPIFETAARTRGIALTEAPVHDASEVDAAIATQGREPGGALILQTDSFMVVHRDLIAISAARYLLPTIGVIRLFPASGCLMSYGIETGSMYQGAATYVDRILKGAKPADLPVQGPTKYELVINLKTAKVLGLAIPQSLLATADEVIE